MRMIVILGLALSACISVCGCGSDAGDSDPPPGVVPNENRPTGLKDSRKSKEAVVGKQKGAP